MKQLVSLILVSLVLVADAKYQFIRGRNFGSSRNIKTIESMPEKWFDQRLDHFDQTLSTTWKQRYWINDQYFDRENGPVFLSIGGEGEGNPVWMTNGHWINLAKEFGALCVMVEHRFYGKSHPTKDLSTENLMYLSSEQALADLASFRTFIHKSYNLNDSNKWISFGGSYPGSLSAWFRLKYPHLVYGAVASSAPMNALVDFTDYKVVVNKSLSQYHPQCSNEIARATDLIQHVLKSHHSGNVFLHKTFKTCELMETENDIINFFSELAGNFEEAVQYNKDNRAFEGVVDADLTIDVLCDIMVNETIGDALHRYAAVNELILNRHDLPCLDTDYETFVKKMKETSWNQTMAEGGRQWTYQTCVEFGFFQTTDSTEQPFGQTIPVKFFIDQCKDIFGEAYTADLLDKAVNDTNINYGAYDYAGSRVVFVNGAIDPWHALGFTAKPPNEFTETIFIEGTAHCADLYPESENDPSQLADARSRIRDIIAKWLGKN